MRPALLRISLQRRPSFIASVLALALAGGQAAAAQAAARTHAWVKPQIVGLVDKGSQAPYTQRVPWPTATPDEVAPDASAFTGFVVNETWAQLEPSPNHYTFAPLRRSLAAVKAYNQAHRSHPLAVKLRLWGGFTAPQWAKTLGGSAPVTFATAKASGTTGRWWTARYRAAWSSFQHRLAASFDSDRLIGSVAVSSCSTVSDEPFVFAANPALMRELFADGWSSQAQEHCLEGAFADYAGWRHTPIEYTVNPFLTYTPGHGGTPDESFTNQIMTRCAGLLRTTGRFCTLSNHGLQSTQPAVTARQASLYAEIDTLATRYGRATAVGFQTYSPDNWGGCQAINTAIAHHALSVELWPHAVQPHGFQGFTAFTASELARWNRALHTHHQLTC